MEIIFIRHAQGEHTRNLPNSLEIKQPALTEEGREQAKRLTSLFHLKPADTVVVSPTLRTIETSRLFTTSQKVTTYMSPSVGPRMFPQRDEWTTLPCDEIYSKQEAEDLYEDFKIFDLDEEVWVTGINKLSSIKFNRVAQRFIEWSKTRNDRVFVVTHDGTINNYRQLLGEESITREAFLGETGWYSIHV